MKCQNCNTENLEPAQFCKNCGDMLKERLLDPKKEGNSINLLLILLGIYLFSSSALFTVNILGYWSNEILIIILSSLPVITTLIIAILIKNKNAKIFLFISFILKLFFFSYYNFR